MAADALLGLQLMLDDEYLPDSEQLKAKLDNLGTLIWDVGPSARKQALEANAYEAVVSAWMLFCEADDTVKILAYGENEAALVREGVLNALSALTPGNPTIIDKTTFAIIFQAFDPSVEEAIKIAALKVMRNICIKSEANRETLATDWKITPKFVDMIKINEPSTEFIRQWCGALKAFVLNDDTSVAYNRSAERKRLIFQTDGIYYLAGLLSKYRDEGILNSIVVALETMAYNEAYCVAIQSAGALEGLDLILERYPTNDRLMINTISCIRLLCVSATVREKAGGTFLVKHLLETVNRIKENPDQLETVISCLAYLTLKNPCSTAQFLSEQGVNTTLEITKRHIEKPSVLKACCLLLRNVAALSGKLGQVSILSAGGDRALRAILEKHPELADRHVYPALRDLGFEVDVQPPASAHIPEQFSQNIQQRLASRPCERK